MWCFSRCLFLGSLGNLAGFFSLEVAVGLGSPCPVPHPRLPKQNVLAGALPEVTSVRIYWKVSICFRICFCSPVGFKRVYHYWKLFFVPGVLTE